MEEDVNHNRKTCFIGLWTNDCEYNIRALLLFIAIQLLLAYSPFGFIIMSTISMTTLFIGVLSAALWGGPIVGGIVGLVFGMASMWEASVTAVNTNDLIFSPLYSGNPIGSVVLALVPRILFGITAGFLYLLALKIKNQKVRIPLIVIFTVLLDRLQSMFTYLFIDLIFHIEGAYAGKAFVNMFSFKRITQYTFTVFIILCCYYLFDKYLSKKYHEEFRMISNYKLTLTRGKHYIIAVVMIVVIGVTLIHLWDRQEIILYEINCLSPEQVSGDRMLQVLFQFIVSTFSAIYILFVFYRHERNVEEIERLQISKQLDREKMKAEDYEKRSIQDGLTNVYNRKGFETIVEQEKLEEKSCAYLLLDIDYFKEINDAYGHDVGDDVLKIVAKSLKEEFKTDYVFRIGGDEFAVIIFEDITNQWQQFCDKLENLFKNVNEKIRKDFSVTLSMGAIYCGDGYNNRVYRLADDALYEVKFRGKAGCCLVNAEGESLRLWEDDTYVPFNVSLVQLANSGICKFEFSSNNEFEPRLYSNAMIRNLTDIKRNATPEECYHIWINGLSKEDQDKLLESKKQGLVDGTFTFDYYWNHPLKGTMQIKSAGTCEVLDGIESIWLYYRCIKSNA